MSTPANPAPASRPQSFLDRSRLLLEINNAIASHLELDPLLKTISECLRHQVAHDLAGLALYDAEIGMLRVHGISFSTGIFVKVGQTVPLEGTPGGLAFTSGKTVLRHRKDPIEFPAEF